MPAAVRANDDGVDVARELYETGHSFVKQGIADCRRAGASRPLHVYSIDSESNRKARATVTSLREKQKELTRQQLIEAALEVFSTNGYRNTSVEDLTRRAGASRATFYLHFSSKVDILVKASGLATADTPELYASLDRALAEQSRPAIEAAIEDIIGWFELHSGLLQAAAEAAMEDPSIILRADRLFDAFFEAMPFVRSQWPRSKQDQAKVRLHLFVLQLERFFQNYAATGRWAFPRAVLVGVLADLWSADFLPPTNAAKLATARSPTKASGRN